MRKRITVLRKFQSELYRLVNQHARHTRVFHILGLTAKEIFRYEWRGRTIVIGLKDKRTLIEVCSHCNQVFQTEKPEASIFIK